MSVNYYEPPTPPNPAQPGSPQPGSPHSYRAVPPLPTPKKRGAWGKFFGNLGAGITWFRNALMNTLFILLLLIFIIAITGLGN